MSRATSRSESPLAVAVDAEHTRSPVSRERLAELARAVLRSERVKHAMLSIALVDRRRMATLNRKHLGHTGPTDVITFAFGEDPRGVVVADIYICPDVAREQAREHGVGVREELARLVVHGVLHACGYDHPEDEARMQSPMWRRQEALMSRFWPPLTTR